MRLGKRPLTADDTRLIKVNYDSWLAEGATLTAASATCDDLTITEVTRYADYFTFLVSGAAEDTDYVVDVQITDTLGQVKNDTIEFFGVGP